MNMIYAVLISQSSALIVWDALLTLSDEVVYVWCQHWNVVNILFFISKYSAMLLVIATVLVEFGPQTKLVSPSSHTYARIMTNSWMYQT